MPVGRGNGIRNGIDHTLLIVKAEWWEPGSHYIILSTSVCLNVSIIKSKKKKNKTTKFRATFY